MDEVVEKVREEVVAEIREEAVEDAREEVREETWEEIVDEVREEAVGYRAAGDGALAGDDKRGWRQCRSRRWYQ